MVMIEKLIDEVKKNIRRVFGPRISIAGILIILSLAAFISGALTGCVSKNNPPKIAYFPIQKEPQTQLLLASIEGNLNLVDGNLRVVYKFLLWQRSSYSIIWPYGYSWVSQDNAILVLDKTGKTVAKVGDYVKCGGGNISPDVVKIYTGQEPPPGTKGPFWLLSEIYFK
jgi:hypothetical protein